MQCRNVKTFGPPLEEFKTSLTAASEFRYGAIIPKVIYEK